eukprot:TRINITY_DN14377_c0_g1_i1.p2 TRINITY_DN14377_c0_g1~~TRINITY_DN14377_c0_g1_i1.p2  ORF type:complete len:164 (+),score=53.44 TRINITY_DN14377_c0_g1_i1:26-493(+)
MAFAGRGDAPEGAEDARELQFGPGFEGSECLTLGEVFHMLDLREEVLARNRNPEAEANTLAAAVVSKTRAYCERFQTPSTISRLKELKGLLSRPVDSHHDDNGSKALHPFEVAAVINLQPDDAEEAKAIIPSLATRFTDDETEHFLKIWRDDMSR